MANKAVNADAFSVRCAHYKCAGYGWRYSGVPCKKSAAGAFIVDGGER